MIEIIEQEMPQRFRWMGFISDESIVAAPDVIITSVICR